MNHDDLADVEYKTLLSPTSQIRKIFACCELVASEIERPLSGTLHGLSRLS